MRKYLTGGLVLVLALTVGMAGNAAAKSTFQSNGHDQGIDLAVAKKGKQLVARSGPLAITGEDYLAPLTATKKAGRVRLLFDEGIKLNSKKFPRCSAQDVKDMEGTSTEDVQDPKTKTVSKECTKAQVSIDGPAVSEAVAAIGFGAGIAVVKPVVTAFNGPKDSSTGNDTLILHTFLSSPVSNTTVLVGQLPKQGGRTLLDVNPVPPLAGGLGALTDFFATIEKTAKDKKAIKKAKKKLKKAKKSGNKKKIKKAKKKLKKAKKKRISYIEAKCTAGAYETTGTWNLGQYTDPTDLSSFVTEFTIQGTDRVPCKKSGDTLPFDPGPGR